MFLPRLLSYLALPSIALALTACNPPFTEGEMKGFLTVDKSQLGNDKLEVKDLDTQDYRFIHPGKKIVQLRNNGFSKIDVIIMDSRRVKLARFQVPTSGFNAKENSFSISSRETGHDWGLTGGRQLILLNVEVVPKTGGRACRIQNCTDQLVSPDEVRRSCEGVIGEAWQVTDARYDYVINFLNELTGKNVGTFKATGKAETATEVVDLRKCTPRQTVYPAKEAFE